MKLNLDKDKKYILGCSSGPDSMCLFSLLLKEKYDFVVCNIDYNYRKNSIEETELVREFCKQNNVLFFTKSVQHHNIFHNFEARARDIRYDYFNEIGNKLGIENVLVAHNEDDLLETYLMQKERKSLVTYYGLNRSYKRKNMIIYRPLLNYKKSDLLAYCKNNNIPYILDPTNSDTTYKRNYYRHLVVGKMSEKERDCLKKEIKDKNIELEKITDKVSKSIHLNTYFSKVDFMSLNDFESGILLSKLINKNGFLFEVSLGLVKDLKNAISKNAKSYTLKIKDNIILTFDYDDISLINKDSTYEFVLNQSILSNKLFTINKDSKYFSNIKNSPIFIIKPAKLALNYKINNNLKKINRIFIDYKMPKFIRNIYPGIFNKNGELIYLPRYRKNFILTKDSLLIFNLENLINLIEKK